MKTSILVLATLFAAAQAACSNQCSGHGKCDAEDRCMCYARWAGPDCSEKECPKGKSWVASSAAATDGPAMSTIGGNHAYTECSSKGKCGAETGECECFAGYTGRACARQACPGGCSGHGRCVYNKAIDAAAQAGFQLQNWDLEMTRQCSCDRGWQGYDCSDRMCPVGNDPLRCTDEAEKRNQNSIQIVDIHFPTSSRAVNGNLDGMSVGVQAGVKYETYITLTYTDMFNGNYVTRPIRVNGDAPAAPADSGTSWARTEQFKAGEETDYDANRIRGALQNLPNFVVPSVNVTNYQFDIASGEWEAASPEGWSYAVTFTDAANSGPQPDLSCTPADAETDFSAIAPRMQTSECPVDTVATACVYVAGTSCSIAAGDVIYGPTTATDTWPVGTTDPCAAGSTSVEADCTDITYNKVVVTSKTGTVGICAWTSTQYKCEWDTSTSTCDHATAHDSTVFSADVTGGCLGTDSSSNLCNDAADWKDHLSASNCVAAGCTFVSPCATHTTVLACHSATYEIAVGTGRDGTCAVPAAKRALTFTTAEACLGTEAGNPCTPASAGACGSETYCVYTAAAAECNTATTRASCIGRDFDSVDKTGCVSTCSVKQATRADTEEASDAATAQTATTCSDRGLCDAQTGLCTCFDGYAGDSCAFQTVYF